MKRVRSQTQDGSSRRTSNRTLVVHYVKGAFALQTTVGILPVPYSRSETCAPAEGLAPNISGAAGPTGWFSPCRIWNPNRAYSATALGSKPSDCPIPDAVCPAPETIPGRFVFAIANSRCSRVPSGAMRSNE